MAWSLGGLELGPGLGVQVAREHWRLSPAIEARLGPGLLGARLDWTQLAWADLVQPRIFTGVRIPAMSGLEIDLGVAVAPIRDEIIRGDARLYDSGWLEFFLRMHLVRQVSVR